MAEKAVPEASNLSAPVVDQALLQKLSSTVENPSSIDDMHKALKYGLELLLASRRDKENEVWNHIIQKDPSDDYKQWKGRVSKIEEEVASLNTKYEQGKGNILSFLNKGGIEKEIKMALIEVIKLLDKEFPKEILVDKLPVVRAIKEDGVPSIEKYLTLKKAFDEIQALLKINEVKCVALRGQKGVGKTTIMRHLNNHHFNDDNSPDKEFDVVIFIIVASDERNKDLYIFQKIADRMRVPKEGNEFEVAERIKRALKDKRYLLILDDVRHPIDGIWKLLDIPKGKKDSKVVITTCYPLAWKSACVQRAIELKALSPDEAWQMFQDIVGDNHLSTTAQLVCERFSNGLPLLIDPIATSFKFQESTIDWQRILNEGTSWPRVEVDGLKELITKLEICYQQLRDPSKQKCFLYAALYPANSEIDSDYFVECCIAQGFLGDVTKYREMRRRGKDVILRHLVNVAFLEEGEEMRYVKMNSLYRQLALYISSKEPDCKLHVDNEQHIEEFKSTSWEGARWVSMIERKVSSLPTSQNFGSLQTLLLQKSLKTEIPATYFQSMVNLLVLNLSGTGIRRLPSLAGLTGLKAFYLIGCSHLIISLNDEIQPLKNLEVFDSQGTQVNFLPYLEHLRCLRISYSPTVNYDEISRLHKIEELVIEVERRFQGQWNDVAGHIRANVLSRNINFIDRLL